MNRIQWQRVAKERLKDAKALLGRKRWAGAYYLSGYVIECGLKACLLRHLGESDAVFSDKKYLRDLLECWTHDLVTLVRLAGLDADFGAACGANPALNVYWGDTGAWSRTGRKPPGTSRRGPSRKPGRCSKLSVTNRMGCSGG